MSTEVTASYDVVVIGGGVFKQPDTVKPMAALIPKQVCWYQSAAAHFAPAQNQL